MLTLQFGQCGNQLGHALFSKISSDIQCTNTGVPYDSNYEYSEQTFNKWFNGISKSGKNLARAVLVDTEQKVIKKICNETDSSWTYRTKNIICQAGGGCANNWTYGYNVRGYELSNVILNCIRQEIERMDCFDGFLLLLSSAGGTGSGIGSCISELLRGEHRTKSILASTILPFSFGEVCTQNYNTLLSLAKLSGQTDAIILFENEQIHSMCTKLLKKLTATMQDMNEIVSEKLMAVLQPTNDSKYSLNSLVSQIASHPSYKLATIKSTPHTCTISSAYEPCHKWNSYLRHLKEILRVPNLNSELTDREIKTPTSLASNSSSSRRAYTRCVSNILVTRGSTSERDPLLPREFEDENLYADWTTSDRFSHFHQKRTILNREKFLALLTNNSRISRSLDNLIDKTWNSYVHAAFLHRYKQFGLEEDDFLQAFAVVENIVKDYKELE